MVGLYDSESPFQLKWYCDSMITEEGPQVTEGNRDS